MSERLNLRQRRSKYVKEVVERTLLQNSIFLASLRPIKYAILRRRIDATSYSMVDINVGIVVLGCVLRDVQCHGGIFENCAHGFGDFLEGEHAVE